MANRVDWYYRQLVSEGDMDGSDDRLEQADWDFATDHSLHGIAYGLELAEKGVPDLTLAVSGPGAAYDQTGKRIFVAATQSVNVAVDSNAVSTTVAGGGNVKIISVFVKFKRVLSNLKKDGNNVDVYYNVDESFEFIVEQSAEGLDPAPAALKSDAKLLGDIRREFGVTAITNAMISYARRQYVFDVTAGEFSVQAGTAEEAVQGVLDALNTHALDATNAHLASAINYAGGVAWAEGTTNPATTVELQLDKIVSDLKDSTVIGGAYKIGAVAQNNGGPPWVLDAGSVGDQLFDLLGLLKDHVTDASAAHAATAVSNTPAGNIAATTVQAALNELDTEKGGLATVNSWTTTNNYAGQSNFNATANLHSTVFIDGGNTLIQTGVVTFAGLVSLQGDLAFACDSFGIVMTNGAPFTLRTHTGDADEVLTNYRTYTICETFSGAATHTLFTVPLVSGRSYMITTQFVGSATTAGTYYTRRSCTIMYANAGAITIAGGTGNVSDAFLDSSPSIVAAGWATSGLNLNWDVNHTGDATEVRCALVVEIVTLKHA